jgi:hypothetical protein
MTDGKQSDLAKKAAGWIALIGVASAALTLYIKWDDWFTKKTACSISGLAFDANTRAPVASLRLGWVPAVAAGTQPGFVTIARSGPDGRFAGSCKGASGGNGHWELLYTQQPNQTLPGLPCLSISHTYQYFSTEGDHSDVDVPVTSC